MSPVPSASHTEWSLDFQGQANNSTASQISSANFANSGQPNLELRQPATATTNPVLLFIDTLAEQFHLGTERLYDLRLMYSLAAEQQIPLTHADILTRLFTLACQFSVEQRIMAAFGEVNGSLGGLDLKGTFEELQIRLQKTWEITKQQKEDLRYLTQETIYNSKRTTFKILHIDVEAEVRKDPAKHSMQNIFGKPSRELRWRTEVKRMSSSIRNNFRQDIRDSIFGTKRCSLSRFTNACAIKYHHGTLSPSQEQAYQIRNVLLRRIAHEHKDLLVQDEKDEDDRDHEDELEPTTSKRKKGNKAAGRIANGEDFWGKVDQWFVKAFDERGETFKTDAWKEYIDESKALDEARHENSRSLERNGSRESMSPKSSESSTPPTSSTSNPTLSLSLPPSARLSYHSLHSSSRTNAFQQFLQSGTNSTHGDVLIQGGAFRS